MLEYFISDSDCKLLITIKDFEEKMKSISLKTHRSLLIMNEESRKAAMLQYSDITVSTCLIFLFYSLKKLKYYFLKCPYFGFRK